LASKFKELDDVVIREQEANTLREQAEAKLADLEKKIEAIEGEKKDQGLLLETAR
jgi:ABC-type hemin transport system substrate-binding protein